jgi:hypothetical protein
MFYALYKFLDPPRDDGVGVGRGRIHERGFGARTAFAYYTKTFNPVGMYGARSRPSCSWSCGATMRRSSSSSAVRWDKYSSAEGEEAAAKCLRIERLDARRCQGANFRGRQLREDANFRRREGHPNVGGNGVVRGAVGASSARGKSAPCISRRLIPGTIFRRCDRPAKAPVTANAGHAPWRPPTWVTTSATVIRRRGGSRKCRQDVGKETRLLSDGVMANRPPCGSSSARDRGAR